MRRIPLLPMPERGAVRVLALLIMLLAACADGGPAEPQFTLEDQPPRSLINGVDDFDRSAVAAIMIYQPTHPLSPGWRSTCTATLIHKRVLTTAGHCIQEIQARLQTGLYEAAWISFQQHPQAHFDADPALADPASGGWYEIESLHNNPDNPDFLDFEAVLEVWGNFHDSGAIVLRDAVKGIQPMKMPAKPGSVEKLLDKAGCGEEKPFCGLYAVGYGLMEFPPTTIPPVQVRQSAPLIYKSIDPLFLHNVQGEPGGAFGALCFGDSGGPFVLVKDNGRDRTITAMVGFPEDPTFPGCAGEGINGISYRVDTESHLEFIKGIIQSLGGS